jgi:Na+/H+ antiporter NhaD/arsenite permease-like protein
MDYVLSFKKDLTKTDIEVITRDVSEHLCEDPDTPQRNHWEPDPGRAWQIVAMSSTFAGNLTLIGSVANLIVAEHAKRAGVTISFPAYGRIGVPLTLASLWFGTWWLS